MPAKHAQDLQQTYAQIAQGFDKRNTPDHVNPEIVAVRETFSSTLLPKSEILDLGAGNGRDSAFFIEQGHKVTLFDLSDEMLELAQQRVPDGIFVTGDMTSLPFEDNSFDGVWASLSILHLTKEEAQAVIERLHQVLRPHGLLYILVKKGEGERVVEENKYGEVTERFFSFYLFPELEQLVTNAGFQIITSEEVISGVNKSVMIFVLARKES